MPSLRWAVVIADLEPVTGHEQGGERRCLVVSYEPFHRSGRVTICPITVARGQGRYPNEVAIPIGEAGQTKPGVILVHQVRTVSLERVSPATRRADHSIKYLTDSLLRQRVREALGRHFGLDIPPYRDGAQ